MKKIYVSWEDIQQQTQKIIQQLYIDNWRPNYIVGLTRGGLTPAILISQYTNIKMHTLDVSLRDNVNSESNLWMAEDAFGNEYTQKNILIVDDINDTGATLNWIKKDWENGCFPNDHHWNNIWGNNVRVAVLYNNESSKSELSINYSAETINKETNPQWIVFPWEEWWQR